MATNKHAQIRYQALDRCFAKRGTKYFWEDLVEACNQALEDYEGGGKGISRRQLFEDIKYMESDQGWAIPLERNTEGKRVWYRYSAPDFSINKRPLNPNEADQLKEALLTLGRFKGMPQFHWVDELVARLESGFGLRKDAGRIIEFQENPYLKGAEHITGLFHGILAQQVLEVTYQGYRQEQPGTLVFHPHYLKQYNNRWFVFGLVEGQERITNLALDRIHAMVVTSGAYIGNTTTDFSEHFDDVVGVTVPEVVVADVIIHVEPKLWPYLYSKPLHWSQAILNSSEKGVTIRLRVKPNFELRSVLLSYGDELTVMEPPELRSALAERVQSMARNYTG